MDEAEALAARAAEAETAGEVAGARADAPTRSRPRHVTREHGALGLTRLELGARVARGVAQRGVARGV